MIVQTTVLALGAMLFGVVDLDVGAQDSSSDDDVLMQELESAAEEDAVAPELSQDEKAQPLAETQHVLQPLAQMGKEVLGNEANPSISIILDTAFAYNKEGERLQLGGHAPPTNGPVIQGAELAAYAAVGPFFEFHLAFGLWHLHMEEVYGTTTALPGNLQIRAGKFKSNIGRHNPTHIHSWRFVVHPMANQFLFGAEGLAPPGIELSWLVPLPWYVELSGALQMGDSGSFRTPFLNRAGLPSDPQFEDFIYPLRLAQFFDFADDWAGQLGLNAVFSPSQYGPEVGNRSYAYGADLLLKWRPIGTGNTGYRFVAIVVEGWLRDMEVPNDLWRDVGGYADIIYGISKRWEVAARGELWRRIAGENGGS